MRDLQSLNQVNANPSKAEKDLIVYQSSPMQAVKKAAEDAVLLNVKRLLLKAKEQISYGDPIAAETLIDLAFSDLSAI